MTEPEQLIDLISAQTRKLLQNHWPDISDFLDDDQIKIGFTHLLSYEGRERTIKTTISFGRRVKDQIEESIDTAQSDLPFKVSIEKPERRE